MAAKIVELRQERATLAKQANDALTAVQTKATAESRVLTAEEIAEQDAFDAKLAVLDQNIKLEEKRNDRARSYGSAADDGTRVPGSGVQRQHNRADDDPRRGFATHQDFFLSAIENSGLRDRADVSDERLRPLAVVDKDDKAAAGELAFMLPAGFTPRAAAGSDEQGEYADTYGGFSVVTTRAPGLLQVGFEGDPTAGLTQNIPMASPSVEIMARTDKDHTTSVSGGFTVTRRPETGAMSPTRMALEMITLKAASLFGLAYATEELLTDSPVSFAALIDAGFRTQFGAKILDEKIRGAGGNEYLGYLNSPAKIEVAKESGQANDTINATNVIKMAARSWGFGSAVWVANHDTKPQLAVLSIPIGTAGVLLYQPANQPSFPDMLWGRPVVYSEYAATVGDVGDLSLVNFSQYLEGVYQPIQGAESVHVRFLNHERTFKLWTRNAGAPWWRSALTPAKSAATLSPIVTLAAR
jgi:HK97 family phage major capsid protein